MADGAIDTDFIRDNFPQKHAQKDQDDILNPEHIADNYWYLHNQPRDAWTFELDVRPWKARLHNNKQRVSTMSKSPEFLFDLGSPATYLAYTQLPAQCAETDVQLVCRPMLLGGVFKATGNTSPISVPAKGRYMFDDLAQYAQRYT